MGALQTWRSILKYLRGIAAEVTSLVCLFVFILIQTVRPAYHGESLRNAGRLFFLL